MGQTQSFSYYIDLQNINMILTPSKQPTMRCVPNLLLLVLYALMGLIVQTYANNLASQA